MRRRGAADRRQSTKERGGAVSAEIVTRNDPPSKADDGSGEWAMTGSNRRLPRCKREGDETEPVESQQVAENGSPVCTRVCTSDGENAHEDPAGGDQGDLLNRLAAALRGLSPEDRARLAAMLAEDQGEGA